jgi:phospholipid/cholesterol/gamma-HCH transport system substrate-binding protein
MSTSSNKRSVIVGVFIVIGIIILIVGVLTLGGQRKTFVKAINVEAVFDDVGGLQKGNNIWFSGVKIGTVKSIRFYGDSKVQISMNIDNASKQYIHKDARAKISTDGLIGNKIIVIYGGTSTTEAIEDGDKLIADKPFNSDEMMATLQENNKNLIGITGDFKIIGKRLVDGKGTIGALLADSVMSRKLNNTMNNLNAISGNLRTASQNSNKVVKSFSDYASKLETPGSLAGELVSDTMVFSNLKAVVVQLQQAATDANAITNNLKQATGKLTDRNTPVGVLLNDDKTATELKNTIRNLETSTQKLDENMEALQHNFLLRGFFRKKAKNEKKMAGQVNRPDSAQ